MRRRLKFDYGCKGKRKKRMRKARAPSPPFNLKSHGFVGGVEVAGDEDVNRRGVWRLLGHITYCATFTQVPPVGEALVERARGGEGGVLWSFEVAVWSNKAWRLAGRAPSSLSKRANRAAYDNHPSPHPSLTAAPSRRISHPRVRGEQCGKYVRPRKIPMI